LGTEKVVSFYVEVHNFQAALLNKPRILSLKILMDARNTSTLST